MRAVSSPELGESELVIAVEVEHIEERLCDQRGDVEAERRQHLREAFLRDAAAPLRVPPTKLFHQRLLLRGESVEQLSHRRLPCQIRERVS